MSHFKKVIKILSSKVMVILILVTSPFWFYLLGFLYIVFEIIFVPISKVIACIYTGRWDNHFHTLTKGGYYNISYERYKNMFNKISKFNN